MSAWPAFCRVAVWVPCQPKWLARACSHRKGIYLIAGEEYPRENAAIGAFPCATVPVKLLTRPDRFETMAAWTSRSWATSQALRRSHPVPAFASVVACANDMVSAVGASEKVSPRSSSRQAKSFAASLHWYEATGIGKREMKIKAFL
jgi:hypothetical protein